MVKKVILPIIGLALVVLLALALLKAASFPAVERLRASFKDKSDIFLNNLAESIAPARKYPLTTIELEERLRANLPVPFAKFTQEDWQWFWHLLYGRYTQDSGGWPRRKKQLNRQEIQNILANNYKPFDRFSEQQWNIFWQHVLKGRVF